MTPRTAGLVLAVLLLPCPARAVQTRSWSPGAAELQRGDADGIAVTSRGALFLAPGISPLGRSVPGGAPAHVWAVASDEGGNAYLGTGPEGRILRVSPAGEVRVLFSVEEPMVTALLWVSGEGLYAGTAPEGKIYRIDASGRGSVWCETGERYVWALARSAGGSVLAATGDQGIVFRIDRAGRAEPFFDSDEPHVVSLVPLGDGGVLAGGAGRGLVYRTDAEGHARVLYDDDLPEVRALALEPGGAIVAATLAPPLPEPRPPAVRIQVSDETQVGRAPETMGGIEDEEGRTIQGVIEGLPGAGEGEGPRLRGRVVRIRPDGSVEEIWRSATEAPYSLVPGPDGDVLFGAGEPARLYRADRSGEVSLVATLREAQITGLLGLGRAVLAATSNPAASYRLEPGSPETGTYLSPPFDAGGPARWGSLRWRVEGDGARVEFYTRSGNSADPDATWSAWSPTLTDAGGSAIVNPEGRFLQWRLRLAGAVAATRVTGATVTYAPLNRPPAVRDFRTDPRRDATSTDLPLRWNVSDPDGDPLSSEVQYRPVGATDWTTAVRVDSPARDEGSGSPESSWHDARATWLATGVDEGRYELRVVVSDRAANPPDEGRTEQADLGRAVAVDRTPPEIGITRESSGRLRVRVEDAMSAVDRLEVVRDGQTRFTVRPDDGVCDAERESFTLDAAWLDPGSQSVLRAVDAAGNAAERSP